MAYRLLAALLFVCPSISWAGYVHTMTFDTAEFTAFPPERPDPKTYTEDGITAKGNKYLYADAGGLHLDYATPNASFVEFTTGGLFTVQSIDFDPLGSGDCAHACNLLVEESINYMWFSGYLDGALVSSVSLFKPREEGLQTLTLSILGTIDLFRVEVKNYPDLGLSGQCIIGDGCGHFLIDSVVLKDSVPEPGTYALLALGLMGAALSRKKKPKSLSESG